MRFKNIKQEKNKVQGEILPNNFFSIIKEESIVDLPDFIIYKILDSYKEQFGQNNIMKLRLINRGFKEHIEKKLTSFSYPIEKYAKKIYEKEKGRWIVGDGKKSILDLFYRSVLSTRMSNLKFSGFTVFFGKHIPVMNSFSEYLDNVKSGVITKQIFEEEFIGKMDKNIKYFLEKLLLAYNETKQNGVNLDFDQFVELFSKDDLDSQFKDIFSVSDKRKAVEKCKKGDFREIVACGLSIEEMQIFAHTFAWQKNHGKVYFYDIFEYILSLCYQQRRLGNNMFVY